MCSHTQGNPTGTTNRIREVIPEDALDVTCCYCAQELFPPEPKSGQSGVAECVNAHCNGSKILGAESRAYKTLRCGQCGYHDLLTLGGGSIQHLMCDHCGADIYLPRIIGKCA